MGTRLLKHGLIAAVICLVITFPATLAKGHVAMFVFGDSLYDPGNNNYINTIPAFQANFTPYGESYFKVPTGRFSDGRLVPDFISEYANLPLIPAYLTPGVHDYACGANFASAGAGALSVTHQGFVIDLKTQLGYFKKVAMQLKRELGAEKSKALISSAVYLLSIGANDYISPFTVNSSFYDQYTKPEYISMVLGNTTQFIHEMYEMGARKFGLLTIVSLGCAPGLKLFVPGNTGACFEEANQLAKMHNEQLPKVIELTKSYLPGFKYSLHDMYTSMNKRLENPSKYGFKDEDMACCGSGPFRGIFSCGGKRGVNEFEVCDDPRNYFFFDAFHPSQRAYKQLAEMIWSGDSLLTKPYTLKSFFQH